MHLQSAADVLAMRWCQNKKLCGSSASQHTFGRPTVASEWCVLWQHGLCTVWVSLSPNAAVAIR